MRCFTLGISSPHTTLILTHGHALLHNVKARLSTSGSGGTYTQYVYLAGRRITKLNILSKLEETGMNHQHVFSRKGRSSLGGTPLLVSRYNSRRWMFTDHELLSYIRCSATMHVSERTKLEHQGCGRKATCQNGEQGWQRTLEGVTKHLDCCSTILQRSSKIMAVICIDISANWYVLINPRPFGLKI